MAAGRGMAVGELNDSTAGLVIATMQSRTRTRKPSHTCLRADYYKQIAEEEGMDEYTSVFMRMTISNIRQRSPLLWCVGSMLAGGWCGERGVGCMKWSGVWCA